MWTIAEGTLFAILALCALWFALVLVLVAGGFSLLMRRIKGLGCWPLSGLSFYETYPL
jgi:hypothetical protein